MKDGIFTKAKEAVRKMVNVEVMPIVARPKTLAETVTEASKGYTLSREYDLQGGVVKLPRGVVLTFRSGGCIKNGTLVGDGGMIKADGRIFYNVDVQGMWDCPGSVGWFADGTPVVHDAWGCRFPELLDQSGDIQKALDSSFRELHFPPKCYYVSQTLVLRREKRLVLHGSDMKLNLEQSSVGKKNSAVIFTDQNICLLRVAVAENYQNAVSIEGGSFDVSLCQEGYTASCIEVRADEKGQRVWGLTIKTNIKGKYNQTTGIGLDINPENNPLLTGNEAYVSQVRINSNISNFGLGVKVCSHHGTGGTSNWASDVVVDGAIINCPVCVEGNSDMEVRAMLQSGKFFDKQENGVALIKYSGLLCSVSSNIFDIRQGRDGSYSNEYALEVTSRDATVTVDGKFRSFCAACQRMGWPVVKGNVTI